MAVFEFILTVIVASVLMIVVSAAVVAITMPVHGALVRLRANYNPRAVGLDGTAESRVGPTLRSLVSTLRRTHRLEGWYGLYKGFYPMLVFSTLVSIASIVFIGGSSTRGPKGVYTVPEAGGVRMALFTIILAAITLPMTIIVNRAIITPYRLPPNPRASLNILLSQSELAKPISLYFTPGLLATTAIHALCVTFVSRSVRVLLIGTSDPDEYVDVASWRWILYFLFQAVATGWLAPLDVIATRLSIQPNNGGLDVIPGEEESLPEGVGYAGADEDVIGLRPNTEPYQGLLDCARKINEEEGWDSLYRGWWWTMLSSVGGAIF